LKTITKYVADDGKEFSTEKQCLEHEYFTQEVAKIAAKFERGANLWDCFEEAAELQYDGQYLYLEGYQEHKEILQKIDKNFKFSIPHWQCVEKPGYALHSIEYEGFGLKFFIYGNAGSWSGPYGGRCKLQDTLRYAQNTIKQFGNSAN